ncbi:MAG: hypothetical protein KJ592_01975 [Nanoarchaeota archaeon]|nr:hypothetical protein [Nanoarchaeota archaeon]
MKLENEVDIFDQPLVIPGGMEVDSVKVFDLIFSGRNPFILKEDASAETIQRRIASYRASIGGLFYQVKEKIKPVTSMNLIRSLISSYNNSSRRIYKIAPRDWEANCLSIINYVEHGKTPEQVRENLQRDYLPIILSPREKRKK